MRLDGLEREIIAINPYRPIKITKFEPIKITKFELPETINNLNQIKEENKRLQNSIISKEEINRLIEELNQKFSLLEKYLKIDIDKQLNMPISKIINMRTEEIIRQIPPEWLVEILRRMEELKGLFYNQEV